MITLAALDSSIMGGIRSFNQRPTDRLDRVRVTGARVDEEVEPGAPVGCQTTDGALAEVASHAVQLCSLGTVHSAPNLDNRTLDFTSLVQITYEKICLFKTEC